MGAEQSQPEPYWPENPRIDDEITATLLLLQLAQADVQARRTGSSTRFSNGAQECALSGDCQSERERWVLFANQIALWSLQHPVSKEQGPHLVALLDYMSSTLEHWQENPYADIGNDVAVWEQLFQRLEAASSRRPIPSARLI
jgi:hypothetical protein